MKTYRIYPDNIDLRAIDHAVKSLRDGDIIIYPTDTLYALGCDALRSTAIERLCRIKDIDPRRSNLSIICADIAMAAGYARIDNRAFAILKNNTPGPFTFILPAGTALPKQFKGRRQVGIRIPDNSIARTLATVLGNPLLTTSIAVPDDPDDTANPEYTAMRYADTATILLDGGDDGTAIPSAIIDLTDSSAPVTLREGPMPLA